MCSVYTGNSVDGKSRIRKDFNSTGINVQSHIRASTKLKINTWIENSPNDQYTVECHPMLGEQLQNVGPCSEHRGVQ